MAKRTLMRNPNNYGTIKRLSGNRRKPYMAGVNPSINESGTYSYQILGYYETKTDAMIALAEYNKNPINLKSRDLTFSDVYQLFYDEKFIHSKKKLSNASKNNYNVAYRNCSVLHNKKFSDLRHIDLQRVLDDCPLKHASLELILTLFKGMYSLAMREEIVQKDISSFVKINIPDDDEHGIKWSDSDVALLWTHTDTFFVKQILIYLYTGWRASELRMMHKCSVSLDEMTMTGGNKTAAGKNRIVPIHRRIQEFVKDLYNDHDEYILLDKKRSQAYVGESFNEALRQCGISTKYTLHDCRHTFISWLDDVGVNPSCRNMLVGHAGNSLDEKVYIHKDVEQLRKSIEMIP